jgi:SAM-dependent methyltransferase
MQNRDGRVQEIHFDDGAAYERYMGLWSRVAGDQMLAWLSPPRGARWLDVGCGNGVFTELLHERCAPSGLVGVDPSPEQLAYARARPALRNARLLQGDAMALPLADGCMNVAIMPLVLFFVPDPAVGVREMTRVVGAGGLVCAYAWDMPGGGFPYHLLQREMRALGATVPKPPSPEASRLEVMNALWVGAGLDDVRTCQFFVQRRFDSFDEYWATVLGGASIGRTLAAMDPEHITVLKARLVSQLPVDEAGAVTCHAIANAVCGRVRGVPS